MKWIDSPLTTILTTKSYQVDSSIYRIYINEKSFPKNNFILIDYSFDIYFEDDILDIKKFEEKHRTILVTRLNELENLRNYFSSINSIDLEKTKSKRKEVYNLKLFKEVSTLPYSRRNKPQIYKKKNNRYCLKWFYCGSIIKYEFSSNNLSIIQQELQTIIIDEINKTIEKINIFLSTMY